MNSKEIKEALEIIKKPITVNCIEYKYFDDENYNKLLEVYENCLWFANNFEQINLTVENLQKENEQLKENNLAMQEEMARTWAKLEQKEDIIYKIKKCIEEKEEYYGDYMGDGNYTMYSMMGANNNRIPYIKSNLIKQILDNKGE